MEEQLCAEKPAGFWRRSAAILVDIALPAVLVTLVATGLATLGIYMPIEITVVGLYLVVGIAMLAGSGQTIGKRVCGVRVQSRAGLPIGPIRAAIRETLGKVISMVFLFLGFLTIPLSRRRLGWHDRIARTQVVRVPQASAWQRRAPAMVLSAAAILLALYAGPMVLQYRQGLSMDTYPGVPMPFVSRSGESVVDITQVNQPGRDAVVSYLRENGSDPAEYAIAMARQHDVIIFGEVHFQKEYMEFFRSIIPDLYHKAGVRCIAMETCPADNANLQELVTGESYDRDLAMRIAREAAWHAWGAREYWDVFETVWSLNHNLPAGAPRMRIVGLFPAWDGTSFAMFTGGPWWERLRAVRVVDDLVCAVQADRIYALQVEREILDKGDRGIVWVGAAHSNLKYCYESGDRGALGQNKRMACLLYSRYGDRIGQILLHQPYYSKGISELVEEAAERAGKSAVGFDVAGSPLAALRDSEGWQFHDQPTVSLEDLAEGYILLKPFKQLHRCEWMDGFITREMFGKHRPFYEIVCKRPLRDAADANAAMAAGAMGNF